MVTGWRRAFCTSIPKERETPVFTEKQHCNSNATTITTTTPAASSHSPRMSAKFGFFSNPSTPRLQSQPVSSPSLRCKTTTTSTENITLASSVPNSPKLQCKTKKSMSPRLFHFSNPSSPKSPSSFSLLKATRRLSKSRCGICLQSIKSGQGTAIFRAECTHVFHFPCISAHVKKRHHHHLLTCPVCSATWKQPPLLSFRQEKQNDSVSDKTKNLRVYNDDEPLMSPSPGSLFNPIPELDENDVDEYAQEFQGFFVNPNPVKSIHVTLLPESAVLTVSRTYQTQVAVLKVRAPPFPSACRRPPVDLVTVLDVSERMYGVKSQMMKRVMRLVISSLNSRDRLSIVAFSATSKRLLPLRRMTAEGRRCARRVVDALGCTGKGMNANDALKKAAKVIEDRRVKNPVASVVIVSNAQHHRLSTCLEIPVHSIGVADISACNEEAIAKRVGRFLSVVVQDVRLQIGSSPAEISAVYSLTGGAAVFGPDSIRLGDFYAEEERELLLELKVPASSIGSQQGLSVTSSFKDSSSHEPILCKEQALLIPRPQAVRSSVKNNIQRLRDIHVTTRAVAESRRLSEHGDISGAHHLLSSARALLTRSGDSSATENLRSLESELGEVNRRRQQQVAQSQMQRGSHSQHVEEKAEQVTPTSAWRAAERLAKVAIMRKHMNRVSDLHGFENARF